MTLRLLIVLTALCLSGCATTSARGDSPASDLDVLEASVSRDLRRTILPNGKEYCAEDAATERQKDDCTGNLEDALFNANRDKESALRTLRNGIKRIKLSIDPCGFFERIFRRDACKVGSLETIK